MDLIRCKGTEDTPAQGRQKQTVFKEVVIRRTEHLRYRYQHLQSSKLALSRGATATGQKTINIGSDASRRAISSQTYETNA